jgi:hypothetical protein
MIGLARSNLAHAYQLAVAIYGNSMHAFVRKLVQKLLELHGYSSERSLLQNVARTITAVVDVGLRKTECLTFDSGGRIIGMISHFPMLASASFVLMLFSALCSKQMEDGSSAFR